MRNIDKVLKQKFPSTKYIYQVISLEWNCHCVGCGKLLSVDDVVIDSSTTIYVGQCIVCNDVSWVLR